MQFFPSLVLQSLAFILPLGFDTLGVSLSLGMRSAPFSTAEQQERRSSPPFWLRSAILFASAEMLMPIIGLFIGYALSTIVGGIMHYIGVFLLIGIGLWELVEEGREYLSKRKKRGSHTPQRSAPSSEEAQEGFHWSQQLLLALSVSMDELAIGFSFGSAAGKTMGPLTFCLLIGLQAFLMTLIGLSLGRALRKRLRLLKEWSELLSAILLIGLGIWLSFS
jgi:putative Mn2+ efflux pump MntP